MCVAILIYIITVFKYTRAFGRSYSKWLQKYMNLTWGPGAFDVDKMPISRSINELIPLPIIGLILLGFLFYTLYGTVYLY